MNAGVVAMGIEEEYAVTVVGADGKVRSPEPIVCAVLEAAREFFHCVACAEGGLMLINGGRLYFDSGLRLEYCTGIHTNPFHAVAELWGARLMLLALCQRVSHTHRCQIRINIGRVNVETGVCSGTHMNHATRLGPEEWRRLQPLFVVLSPLLTGAGHFTRMSFASSQRTTRLANGPHDPIMQLHEFPRSRRSSPDTLGYCRCHDTTADSSHSQKSMVLHLGLVALLKLALELGMLEEELRLLQPRVPLRVMSIINVNPRSPFALNGHHGTMNGIELARAVVGLISLVSGNPRLLAVAPWAPRLAELAREALDGVEHSHRHPFVVAWQPLLWLLRTVADRHPARQHSAGRSAPLDAALRAAQVQYFDLQPSDRSIHHSILPLTDMQCPEISPELIERSQREPLANTSSRLIHEFVRRHAGTRNCHAQWDRLRVGNRQAVIPHPRECRWESLRWTRVYDGRAHGGRIIDSGWCEIPF